MANEKKEIKKGKNEPVLAPDGSVMGCQVGITDKGLILIGKATVDAYCELGVVVTDKDYVLLHEVNFCKGLEISENRWIIVPAYKVVGIEGLTLYADSTRAFGHGKNLDERLKEIK